MRGHAFNARAKQRYDETDSVIDVTDYPEIARRQDNLTPMCDRPESEHTMLPMRLDHLSFAAGPDGLASTAQRIGGQLGKNFIDGGVHPRFGTRNMIMPLDGRTYIEIVEVLDHPASDKAPFGQAVRARSALGGGWLGWVVAVDDITTVETWSSDELVQEFRRARENGR